MEDWVFRALARWPDVPALYGWLGLDRRGRWTIRGEAITRPQIIDTIAHNYAADERGAWYFQNGPQRGYVSLETAPLVLQARPDGRLLTHTGRLVGEIRRVGLDEEGSLLIVSEHGPGALDDRDLDWALSRLLGAQGSASEAELAAALALPDGAATALRLAGDAVTPPCPVWRLDGATAPAALGFVRNPVAPA